MEAARYTRSQALAGIQAFYRQHVDAQAEIDAEAPLLRFQDAVTESHECPLLFLEELAEYFGLNWGERRWVVWVRLPRRRRCEQQSRAYWKEAWLRWEKEALLEIRVRDLADLIASRAPAVSMAPESVFGRLCAPAGAFRGLASLPEVNGRRIGPSTELQRMLGASRLRELWKRAEWVSGVRLPRLPERRWEAPRTLVDWLQWFGSVASLTTALVVAPLFCPLAGITGGTLVALIAAAAVYGSVRKVCDRIDNPLPTGVQTFGDLARLIAEGQPSSCG